jgi:2-(1,2-epoxy-1,2-dihydrophenyl)acetyl-CoA isomerase
MTMSTPDALIETEMDGSVMVIRLADPRTRNSLTTALRAALGEAVMTAQRDTGVRAVLLTGKGPTFCAGGNLDSIKADSAPWVVHRRFRNLSQWLFPLIWLDRPVVVAVNGQAVGGGMGLALTGDLLVAGESARLMAGFFRLGVVPDIGLMYHLPRLIGMARAKSFLFGNGTMTAREAEALGLVARVVADDQVEAEGMREAQRLAAGPVDAMGLAKQIMARSFETSMLDMFAYEGFGQALAMASPEFREGLGAMMARRTPDFPGAAREP